MLTTYQYRIYPTYKQRRAFIEQIEACRHLYNDSLAQRKETYEETSKGVSYNQQAKQLTQRRSNEPYWNQFHIDILQDTLKRLDKAFKAFFRRIKADEAPGYPRYKGKGRYRSVTYYHTNVGISTSKRLIGSISTKAMT